MLLLKWKRKIIYFEKEVKRSDLLLTEKNETLKF